MQLLERERDFTRHVQCCESRAGLAKFYPSYPSAIAFIVPTMTLTLVATCTDFA